MQKFTVKTLVFSAVAIALAMVTSFIKIIDLPMGGAVTLFSMLFITLIGYWFGPLIGIIGAVVYGILQFITNPAFFSFLQFIFDYILAFGCLGLSGFFNKFKFGLQVGYLVSIFGRFVFGVLSGIFFFASYAEGTGFGPFIYSVLYNGSYIGLEGIITIAILFIPAVRKGLNYIKKLALS